jgi:predicted transcriptional regulator of viral defense system
LEDLVEYWLWTERVGVFSHETALFHHGLSDVLPTPVVLTVPEWWRRRRLRVPDGLTLRHGEISDAERSDLGPVPFTTPLRTIRDTIDVRFDSPSIERALALAYQRGLITLDDAHALEGRIHRTLNR